MSGSYFVVLITAPSTADGERIARSLVDERLAACVNVVPGCRSVYRWEGQIHADEEALLIAKTTKAAFDRFRARVDELHPYDTPEIVAIRPEKVAESYARFLDENVGP